MHSKWKITSQYLDDTKKVYAVYRLRDMAATDHAGNREFATCYMPDEQMAIEAAEKLNREEKTR